MLQVESYKKGIVLSTVFNVFNKGLVFLNGILVAYFFSARQGTDIYFYLYNSTLLLGVFFTSMNGAVIIPESMRIRKEEGNDNAVGFLNFFIFLYAGIALCLLVVVLINPLSFFLLISNFPAERLSDNRLLLYLSLPLFAIIIVLNLLIDILTSYKFFTIPMIVGIINGVCSFLFVLALHETLSIRSALFGLLFSYSINLFMLIYLLKRYAGWRFSSFKRNIPKRIWKNLGFAQMGNLASSISSYMPMYILSGFNVGIITALTFAQQISSLPNALITTQFSSVAGIKFNELYAGGQLKEIDKIFRDVAGLLHFILFPISFFLFFFSDDVVNILLSFTSLDAGASAYVATFLRYLGFLLPLFVINSLISRLFMASHKIRKSFGYQVLFNIALIIALFICIRQWGVIGYPLALVGAYALNILVCYYLEKHYFNIISYKNIIRELVLIGVTNAVLSTLVFYIVKKMNIGHSFLAVSIAFTMYGLLLLAANYFFQLNPVVSEQVAVIMGKVREKNLKKS